MSKTHRVSKMFDGSIFLDKINFFYVTCVFSLGFLGICMFTSFLQI